jgi:endonuclease/exonuclease/phosphatase family metal-dependent hydrolase
MPLPKPADEGALQPLRLLTFNTWKCDGEYALRLQAMVRQLSRVDADVIALQEVFATDDGQVHTGRHLAQALGMELVDAPVRAKPRWHEGRWQPSFSGLALLTRWPVQQSAVLPLPSVPEDGERIALSCDIQISGHRLRVVNTHLTHLENARHLRHQQWQAVLDHADTAPADCSVLVCGDLNAPLSDPALQAPLAQRGWIDVSAAVGLTKKSTFHELDGTGHDLDHVVARPDSCLHWKSAQVALDGPDPVTGAAPSDHAALWVLGGWCAP